MFVHLKCVFIFKLYTLTHVQYIVQSGVTSKTQLILILFSQTVFARCTVPHTTVCKHA